MATRTTPTRDRRNPALRAERAQILGFPTHAHLRMADTMAGTPERAQDLMMRVWPAAVARVHEEVRDMQAIANRQRANITIEPWDYNYYAEQVRRDRYNLDQNEVREYFELNNMINAAPSTWPTNSMACRSAKSPAPCRCSSRACACSKSPIATARIKACSTSITSPAPASARARG
jgi:hypothetical protein